MPYKTSKFSCWMRVTGYTKRDNSRWDAQLEISGARAKVTSSNTGWTTKATVVRFYYCFWNLGFFQTYETSNKELILEVIWKCRKCLVEYISGVVLLSWQLAFKGGFPKCLDTYHISYELIVPLLLLSRHLLITHTDCRREAQQLPYYSTNPHLKK